MARGIGADAQEAIATARFIRMSPTKARQMVDLIRDRHVDDARRVLRFSPRIASVPIGKVLESAIANAEHNRGLPADELIVARAWVDQGPTLRRYRPRALGRATRIRKRTCHISIVVGRPDNLLEPPATPAPRHAARSPRRRRDRMAAQAGTAAVQASEPTPSPGSRTRRRTEPKSSEG